MNGLRFIVLTYLLVLATLVNAENGNSVEMPSIPLEGISYDIQIGNSEALHTELNGHPVKQFEADGKQVISIELHQGDELIVYESNNVVFKEEIRTIPLWLSILPPLIAILLALIFKEVISSLFIGLFIGTLIPAIFHDGVMGIFTALLPIVNDYVIKSLNDSGHLSVIVFSMLIGATVSVISKNGGMKGVVDRLSKYAKSRRSGQFVTWLLGILIFFDDYANTLIVGNTMRPATDKLKISREKLSYIVDSTAAPIAAIAFVTTWIGAELGYIQEGLHNLEGINESVYGIFLSSLLYSFYPILALLFIAMIIYFKKDYGPMVEAEHQAQLRSSEDLQDALSSKEMSAFEAAEGIESKWYNAAIPIALIILSTIAGLLYTGWNQGVWNNAEYTFMQKLSETIGASDSYTALLWSSLIGLLSAALLSIGQRILNVHEVTESVMNGFKTMLTAMIILVLAWSLSEITFDLRTADFLAGIFSGNVSPYLFPALTFVLSGAVAFSTGSSWGTMAILYPLLMPLSWSICLEHDLGYNHSIEIFYNTISCVLAGSVLGDHCSPISDTTILSSLASSCNHIEHVRTQLPYALTVGIVALIFGTIPSAIGISPLVCLLVCIGLLMFIVRRFGSNSEVSASEV